MRRSHLAALALAALLAAPATVTAQAAESNVICKDGSTSKGGKGACSGHGGVDKKATKARESGGAASTAKPAASSSAPAANTVVCKDGTTSAGGKGACSGHGGVDKKATKAGASPAPQAAATQPAAPSAAPPSAPAKPAPAAPAAASAPAAQASAPARATAPPNAKNTDPTGAIARCKDGTYSHAKGHSGACSSHGGVAEWLDKPAK